MEAHLERVASDVTDKLANAAAFYTLEYMAAKERGEHMPHGLDSVLKPIVAAALAACARESEKPLLETLTRIRRTAARDQLMNDPSHLLEEVYRLSVVALERAVGEKASLDPQGGQHES